MTGRRRYPRPVSLGILLSFFGYAGIQRSWASDSIPAEASIATELKVKTDWINDDGDIVDPGWAANGSWAAKILRLRISLPPGTRFLSIRGASILASSRSSSGFEAKMSYPPSPSTVRYSMQEGSPRELTLSVSVIDPKGRITSDENKSDPAFRNLDLHALGTYSRPLGNGLSFGGGLGFGGGAGLQIGLGTQYSLQIDWDLIFRRFNIDDTSGMRGDFKSTFVRMPITLQRALGAHFEIGAGAYGAIMLGGLQYKTGTTDYQATAYHQSLDYGFIASAGGNVGKLLRMAVDSHPVTFEIQYSHGLRNVSSSSPIHYSDVLLSIGFGLFRSN